eukprot:CAMPEP_0172393832 /NCGR_PEP_ID=MMETSP1061-20121228/12275_1 /TAXON_ID=37318 /ORGANISM="Pseudo-nitzschia pungens, Strain cf. pungens" /LENGTH=534 /DNA_ID=CAMNT_0013125041 /DNA_START=135 /DNA_END=1742 /DNA_ORIENTATION=-
MLSYRIGNPAKAAATNSIVSESKVLRSLFEVRKSCNDPWNGSLLQERPQLTFWNCQWSKRIIQSLYKLVVRDGQHFSSIKFFNCDVNNKEFAEILTILLKNNSTNSLVIKQGNLVAGNSNENHRLSQRCQSSLRNFSADESVLTALCEGMPTNTSLESLKLSGLKFENATENANGGGEERNWCQILTDKSNLRHLDLSNSSLCSSTVTNLSKGLLFNDSLRSLNLSRCSLDDDCLSEILGSLKAHPNLTKLNLSRNFLGKSSSTLAVDAVAELLRSKNSKLSCLDLSKQQHARLRIQQTLEASAEEMEFEKQKHQTAFANALNALSTNTTLRRIDLSGNGPCLEDQKNVEALTSCLVANQGLLHADVSSCQLTPCGIQYLGQYCIPHCTGRLKSLILLDKGTNSNCADESGKWDTALSFLCSGVLSNTTLENLGDVDDAATNPELRSRLLHLLNLNRAGRRALVAHDMPLAAWSHVLARAGRVTYNNGVDGNPTSDNEIDNAESHGEPTCTDTSTTPSVLFSLLQGPALFGGSQ